jgi:hypothetical protein
MPSIAITRSGSTVGSLDIPEIGGAIAAAMDSGVPPVGLAIAIDVGDEHTAVVFAYADGAIEIATPFRWFSTGGPEGARAAEQGMPFRLSEGVPLIEVEGDASPLGGRGPTDFQLRLQLTAWAHVAPFRLLIYDHSGNGRFECAWEQAVRDDRFELDCIVRPVSEEGGFRVSFECDLRASPAGSDGYIEAEIDSWVCGACVRFSLDTRAGGGSGEMAAEGPRDLASAQAWLLQQIAGPLAHAEIAAPVRIRMGLVTYDPALMQATPAADAASAGPRAKPPQRWMAEPPQELAVEGAMEGPAYEPPGRPEEHEVRATPPEPQFRQLQARVYDDRGEAEPSIAAEFFRPDSAYIALVRIGFADRDWLGEGIIVPENLLPPSPTGHRLTIVFVEPNHHPRPSIGYLDLPPSGNSSVCSFRFRTAADVPYVYARVAVLFSNRVLVTAILEGKIVEAATADSAITFRPEVLVNPLYSGLESQEEFDQAIILNHTPSGAAQALHLAGDKAELISLPDDLEKEIAKIDRKLGECNWVSPDYASLRAKGTVRLLRFLANRGFALYSAVMRQFLGADHAREKPLQVVAARPESRLPVEFFYDCPEPSAKAKLCDKSDAALASGKCDKCPGKDASVICPLGFWGLSRVIEWCLYDPRAKRELTNSDFAFFEYADSLKQDLSPLSCALLGASEKAGKGDPEWESRIAQAFQVASGKPLLVARSWAEWVDYIKQHNPSLLILITHTDRNASDTMTLEVGDGAITVGTITQPYVHPRPDAPLPVVLLLGCSTGAPEISFEGAIAHFCTAEAAIIVSTITTIEGRHASQVAAEFIRQLAVPPGTSSRTFGEIVQTVRRELLRRGITMVLAVTSYGDAGCRLKGA